MTAKEELFSFGARKVGWSPITTPNVTEPGYRLQPNAILPPDPRINDPSCEIRSDTMGCTLRALRERVLYPVHRWTKWPNAPPWSVTSHWL